MTQTLIDFISQYALDHYEDGGWDVIHECWDDTTIAEYLSEFDVTTEAEALDAMHRVVDVWADRQADARNSAF